MSGAHREIQKMIRRSPKEDTKKMFEIVREKGWVKKDYPPQTTKKTAVFPPRKRLLQKIAVLF